MGFGSLFIGYFLLLNFTYNAYTDLIAALIMMLGLYKLSSVNRPFKLALIPTVLFALIGAVELIFAFVTMFSPAFNDAVILSYVAPLRYIAICLLSAFMLMGIREVSAEVGLHSLAKSAAARLPLSYAVFVIMTVLEIPLIEGAIPLKVIATAAVIMLICAFITVVINLATIYKAYMKICMPEDRDNGQKPSRLGFVNRMRAHEEEKQKEYADYRMQKIKNGKNNSKKKRK